MAVVTVPVPSAGLDAIQQGLFAVALGLRSLRDGARDDVVARELERLEAEVDELIQEVRSRASASAGGAASPSNDGPPRRVGAEERRDPHRGRGR
jgi:cob(I)alamin adenosyltransferase